MKGNIRKYSASDVDGVMLLLELNTPQFFAPEERKDLMDYLHQDSENYFVFLQNDQLIGAGGINYGFNEGRSVRISWDIIHPEFQRKGIGSALLQFRLQEIRKHQYIRQVIVRTSQHVALFYERSGFTTISTQQNYWAPGFDLIEMSMDIR